MRMISGIKLGIKSDSCKNMLLAFVAAVEGEDEEAAEEDDWDANDCRGADAIAFGDYKASEPCGDGIAGVIGYLDAGGAEKFTTA